MADTAKSRKYLGSGYALKPAIEKYGRENFKRVTLAEFSCSENAYNVEAAIVTEEFCNREDTYNIQIGGKGGGSPAEESRARMSAAQKGKTHSEETRKKLSNSLKGNTRTLGRKLTDEHRAKMSASKVGAKHHSSKQVTIDGRYYESALSAAKAENVVVSTVLSRVRSNNPKWSEWGLLERKTN